MSARLPGTPPRALVALAFAVLITATGAAVWLLPPGPEGAGTAVAAGARLPVDASAELAGMEWARRLVVQPQAPSGLVTYVDTARRPGFDPLPAMRRTGSRWFALGPLTAGPDGCTPRWHGVRELDGDPVAARVRGTGGAGAAAALGGSGGHELALTCADQMLLTAAYRDVAAALGAPHLDVQVADGFDTGATQRRARALRVLKQEAERDGRPLTVSFALPVSAAGLSPGGLRALRVTAGEAADVVDTVNLLARLRPTADGGHRRALAAAVRAARAQVARVLHVPASSAWRRMALTVVLAAPSDLTLTDAGKLAGFADRNDLAWLGVRGAPPATAPAAVLSGSRP